MKGAGGGANARRQQEAKKYHSPILGGFDLKKERGYAGE